MPKTTFAKLGGASGVCDPEGLLVRSSIPSTSGAFSSILNAQHRKQRLQTRAASLRCRIPGAGAFDEFDPQSPVPKTTFCRRESNETPAVGQLRRQGCLNGTHHVALALARPVADRDPICKMQHSAFPGRVPSAIEPKSHPIVGL